VFEREEVAESELARVAAAKWRPRAGEERPKARARLHAFLARRGFSGDAIREVMAELLPGPEGPGRYS
jgi:SOS response regulatory protein OraA/RecX